LLWANIHVVYSIAGGHYFAWFRGWHVAQMAVLALLFVRLLRPGDAAGVAALPVGFAALIGIHTFAGTVREAFPINTFMTILLCCFAAADLALGERRWWRTVAALILFAFAALTVESGLLVGVVIVAAYMVGGRGVSRAGAAGIVALTAAYLLLRFVYLDVGAPGLVERSSGYGFSSLDPSELAQRFGAHPLRFYAYNVMASLGSVLFAEPRGGVFAVTRELGAGEWPLNGMVNICASATGTMLIAWYAWSRRHAWQRQAFDRDDRLVVIFALVLIANAVISYAYTKDVILSPAGAFFAVALTIAVRRALALAAPAFSVRDLAVASILLVTATTWAIRAVGAEAGLRYSAHTTRNAWVYADQWIVDQHIPATPAAVHLKDRLQDDAIRVHPAPPMLTGDWLEWHDE
jgi:hypothetical protein